MLAANLTDADGVCFSQAAIVRRSVERMNVLAPVLSDVPCFRMSNRGSKWLHKLVKGNHGESAFAPTDEFYQYVRTRTCKKNVTR